MVTVPYTGLVMSTSEAIALGVGIVNALALLFVGWQTLLTRQTVQIAQNNISESQRTREISELPKADLIIQVRIVLERWRSELQDIINDERDLRKRIRSDDKTLGTEYGLESPSGIIRDSLYHHLPPWLQMLLATGAQYYFNCKSAAFYLSGDGEFRVKEFVLRGVLDRANEGATRISEMLSYLENIVPEWYLDSPASLSDTDFMTSR